MHTILKSVCIAHPTKKGKIMATESQIKANRKNAQKSTGPRTEEGKEAASQNATKHGLCSCKNVIRCESQDEYNLFCDEMIDDLSPVGAMEFLFAERIVSLSWRLKRSEVYQNAVVESRAENIMNSKYTDDHNIQEQARNGDMSLLLGMLIRNDFANSKILEQLLVYEKRIESSLYKAAAEFRKLQKLRREREAIDETRRTKDEGREVKEDARETMDEKHLAKHPASQESYAETRTQIEKENRIQDTENRIGNNEECHPQTAFVAATPGIDEGRKTMDEGREVIDDGKITDNFAKQSQSAGFQPEKPNSKSETLNMEDNER